MKSSDWRLPEMIEYFDSLFVSGNSIPVTTTLFSKASWDIIKECLAESLPLSYNIVEAEAVYRRKVAAYGDETRAESPLAKLRVEMKEADEVCREWHQEDLKEKAFQHADNVLYAAPQAAVGVPISSVSIPLSEAINTPCLHCGKKPIEALRG